jgi:hypothetical protein
MIGIDHFATEIVALKNARERVFEMRQLSPFTTDVRPGNAGERSCEMKRLKKGPPGLRCQTRR